MEGKPSVHQSDLLLLVQAEAGAGGFLLVVGRSAFLLFF